MNTPRTIIVRFGWLFLAPLREGGGLFWQESESRHAEYESLLVWAYFDGDFWHPTWSEEEAREEAEYLKANP